MNILARHKDYNKVLYEALIFFLVLTSFFFIERFIYISNLDLLPWVRDIFSYSFFVVVSIFTFFYFFERKIWSDFLINKIKLISFFVIFIIICSVIELIQISPRFDMLLDLIWVFFIYLGFDLLNLNREIKKRVFIYSSIILIIYSLFLLAFVPCYSFYIFGFFFDAQNYCANIYSIESINHTNLKKEKSIAYLLNFYLIFYFLFFKKENNIKLALTYFIINFFIFLVLIVIKSKSGLILLIAINLLFVFLTKKRLKIAQIFFSIFIIFLSINTLLIKPNHNVISLWANIFKISLSKEDFKSDKSIEFNELKNSYKIILERDQYRSYDVRYETTLNTLSLFKKNLLFGVGFGNLALAKYKNYISHSYLINFLAAYGLLGFIFFISFIFVILRVNYSQNYEILKSILFLSFILLTLLATPDLPWFFGLLVFLATNKSLDFK